MWKNFKFEGWPGGNRNHGDQKLVCDVHLPVLLEMMGEGVESRSFYFKDASRDRDVRGNFKI